MTIRPKPSRSIGSGRDGDRRSLAAFRPLPAGANPNAHTPRGLGMLDDAMARHGYVAPMTSAADGAVLDGNARLETAAVRFDGVAPLVVEHDGTRPVIMVRTDIPNAEHPLARDIIVSANRVAEADLSWDADVLRMLQADGVDLSGLWGEDELAELLGSENGAASDDDKDEQPTEGPFASVTGRVYELGPHRLACGDSTDPAVVASVLDGAEPRLWICDPPYDLSYFLWPLLPSIDVVAVWHRGKSAYQWMGQTFAGDEWGCHGLVFTGGVRGQHRPSLPCCMHDHVTIWRRKWWTDELTAIDPQVIRACGCKKTVDDRPITWQEHVGGVLTGAEGMSWGKPIMENAIAMAYVPAGSIVWDPCAGSGSSLLAAAQHGRVWRGVEMQPQWADLIRRRWTAWADKNRADAGPGALRQVVESERDTVIRSASTRARQRPSTIARQERAIHG